MFERREGRWDEKATWQDVAGRGQYSTTETSERALVEYDPRGLVGTPVLKGGLCSATGFRRLLLVAVDC